MELYIIRHGETDWNKEKRLQGRSDTELNEYGIELAEITGEALKDVHFDCIYSSPLKRAYKTAEIIRGQRNLEIITDERLREISFGVVEGVPMSERPDGFQKFFTDPANYADQQSRGRISAGEILLTASENERIIEEKRKECAP